MCQAFSKIFKLNLKSAHATRVYGRWFNMKNNYLGIFYLPVLFQGLRLGLGLGLRLVLENWKGFALELNLGQN